MVYLGDASKPYNGLGQPNYNIFNPPDYWTSMITDPTQVPVQLYPYGAGGSSAYGPYPGFYFGQRPMTYQDAERQALERQKAMERRAATTDDPEWKYISPEGSLNPRIEQQLVRAAQAQQKPQGAGLLENFQNRILMMILIGAVLSAILK